MVIGQHLFILFIYFSIYLVGLWRGNVVAEWLRLYQLKKREPCVNRTAHMRKISVGDISIQEPILEKCIDF